MPELPEVETVRLGLVPALEGRILTRVNAKRADLRIPFPENFAARLTGRRVLTLSRRAKYLLVHLDNGDYVVVGGEGTGNRFDGKGKPNPQLAQLFFFEPAQGLDGKKVCFKLNAKTDGGKYFAVFADVSLKAPPE